VGLRGRIVDGKYAIGERIAAGGMSEVYAARHTETERHLALKILRTDPLSQSGAVERLRREARAAGRIGHDNICDVIDVGRLDDGTPYLVMPLLRGRTLAAVLRDAGPLPVPRCIDIGAQVLSGLAAAHAAGILHRDLKPQNVFLVRMGDRDDFVKILDFGISKELAAPPTDGSITQTGTVLGTPLYMAPEQVRGRKDLDPRVDLYAAGVLLYQMATNHLPFQGDSYSAIVSAILLDPFPLPRRLRPDLPEPLEALILRAMSRDRDARFPDAETMRAALLAAHPDAPASTPLEQTQPAPAAFGETGPHSTPPDSPQPTGVLHSVSINSTAAHRHDTRHRRRLARLVAAAAAVAAAALATTLVLHPLPDSDAGRSTAPAPHAATPAAPNPDPTPTPTLDRTPAAIPTAAPQPPPTHPTPAAAPAEAPLAAQSVARPPQQDMVEIRFAGLPAGATIEAAGRPVQGDRLRLPRSDAELPVRIAAPGYRDWRADVPCREDRTVNVRMTPTRTRRDTTATSPDSSTTITRDAVPVRPGTVPDYSLGP